MPELSGMIEQSAAAAMTAESGDMPSCAELHTRLTIVNELAAAAILSAPAGKGPNAAIQSASAKAMSLVEKIVLAEVNDANSALQEVRALVTQMQDAIEGKAISMVPSHTTTAPVPAKSDVSSPPPGVPANLTEQPVKPDDVSLVRDFVGEGGSHMDAAEASLLALEEDAGSPEHINAIFRAFHTIKGVAGFLDLRQIGALAHAAENLLDRARKGILPLDSAGVDAVLASVDVMRRLITGVAEAAAAGVAPAPQDGLPEMLARLAAAARGEIAASSKQPAAPKSNDNSSPETRAAAPAQASSSAKTDAASKNSSDSAKNDAFVKVSTERLDLLINTVGELVIAQAMVAQDVSSGGLSVNGTAAVASQRLTRNMSHLGKITRSLQDLSMSMRMVPIQGVFQKMARLARDVARKNGKEIDFVQVGGETELDRNVVEAVSDPLVHMVRNAIDHGIESPDDRGRAHKPRAGRVQLKAYHLAGNVVIEVSDDGRGLNKARILAKASAAGIVKEGQSLSDDEIFRLIFHAGLSTAEVVTDISGRGVGMDVARKNVEALRGRIDIASEEGHGSLFTIRLPLTLAVIDGLVVRVGRERYIIPITSIDQSFRPTPKQLSTVQNTGEMCLIRERLLPVVRLNRLYNVSDAAEDPTRAILVIVQMDQDACCVMVDELLGQQQVVIKSLGSRFGHAPGISGGAILGDGNVSLILDVPGLLALGKNL